MNRYKSQKGFTLIEVMIVVVIIGVMAAIAVPSIRAWVPRYQIRSVKRDIVSAMQLARMRAIGSGHYCYVDFDYNGNGINEGFFTCFLDTDDDGVGELNNGLPQNANEFQASQMTPTDSDPGVPVVRLPAHVSYGVSDGVDDIYGDPYSGDGVTFNGKRASFRPNGRGEMGTVYIHSDRDENYAITVNILGRIKVRKWDGANWVD